MSVRHKVGAVVTTALMTAGLVAVGAAPALAASAPSCISRNNIQWYSVILTNNCPQGAGYNVRVIWNNAPDSGCYWLPAPGQLRVNGDTRYPFISYNSTVLC
ncbi:hypothetical protein [Actinoplanes couchii]|uniref:Alpha amylase inhibitor n=1 Tax=Actinoplanes couchii TaxID=403638 RepID=A0ABQ3WZW7_9ACTN|nr:hypothetical protein [Actinoplanes couchii]MDR6316076.1 hypothetical protein [Actinoplanes couchii]GID51690.1 hypothetical protein Aco03nite_000940 [Actinoplanes couchii]